MVDIGACGMYYYVHLYAKLSLYYPLFGCGMADTIGKAVEGGKIIYAFFDT